ncbi:PAS domain S-box protein [Maribacter litoralis]|uniref:PAS domain S-box protein n=1 Tax=Maribacter litoralis TaxID=2059726 RepID=UPI003F5CCF4A
MKGSNILDTNRLEALISFDVMDTHPEAIYDEITSLAASICNTPVSLISLVDDKRQFFKSHFGFEGNGTPLKESFCKHVITDDLNVLVVEDTHADKRFQNNKLVTEDPNVGFYAGASLTTADGHRLGTLCVIDYESRQLNETQIDGLQTLAKQVVHLLELRKAKVLEQKQKIELEKKGRLLDNIVSATGIGIWERNMVQDTFSLNETGIAIFGIDQTKLDNFKTDDWFKLIYPADLPLVQKKMLECLKYPSKECSVQYRLLQKNGEFKWVHEKGKVLKWNDAKEPLSMYGTIQDITQKKTFTTELQRVKNNQEAMINSTRDLMWSIDLDFNLITANTAFHELVKKIQGKPFEEGNPVFSASVPQSVTEKWKSYYHKALESGSFSVKQKIQDPDKFWTTYGLTSFDLMYNKEGETIGIACFSKDITSEILSQQVLINAKAEMQKIMDTSLDIICTIDEEGYFLSINKAVKEVWGYAPKDIIGTNYIELVYKEDHIVTEQSAASVLSGKKVVNFENRYVHKNGHVVPMIWSSNWDEKDRVYYCIAKDNTEKKKAAEQLANSERRFKTLVQEGSDMICLIDEKADFTYASPTSIKVLNITPEQFIGTNAFDYIHPDDYETVYNEFIKVLKIPQVNIKPFRFKHGDGHWVWLETVITNKIDEPTLKGIVANSKDVTTKVQHLKAIESQNAQLKKIAWTQSHIVRAPVARLMGLVDLLRDDKEKLKLEERDQILNYIITSADEIDNVIKDIVDNTINAIDLDENK